MSNNPGQFNTFQLFDENRPGPTQNLTTPFNKSSKKPRQPKPYIPNSAIAKVNMRMDSVEKTLSDYMPLVNRLIEEECLSQKRRKDSTLTYSSHGSFPSTPATADFEEGIPIDDTYELVKVAKQRSQRVIKSVDIEEYPRILVSHFFAINEYTSYPRVLDFTEYSTTFRNQHPPDYLISAMIADSSLVSPSIHLHRQNLEFFEHHYQLSLTQMLPYLAKPNIILIQAILILWEADHNMGNFTRCIERMTSAIRLSQTLNFHQISDPSSRLYQIYNKQQLNTIRKLWDLMHFRDHQIAQLVNRPALLPPYEKELRDYNLGNPIIKHQELLGQSKHSFPKYYDTFLTHCPPLANILTNITHLVSGTNSQVSIAECTRLLRQIESWHKELPNYVKYFPVCLSIEHRMNSPMITMRILCHLTMLNGKFVLLRYLLSSPSFAREVNSSQVEIISLAIKVSHEQLQMLQHWFQYVNSQLIGMSDDAIEDEELEMLMKPPFPIEYFSELGFVYLQILKNLSGRNEHKLTYVLHDYDQLIKLLDYFGNCWDGANYVISTLECWKSKLNSSAPLPKPLIQFNCDRFLRK